MLKKYLIAVGLLLINFGNSNPCFGQNQETIIYEPTSLVGPRLGVTFIGGKLAQTLRDDYDAIPIITQFGWQFEWRFFSVENGPTGIVECVPLIGGLEQGLFLPSLTVPFGMRFKNGFELGVGPNASVSGFGVVIATGVTIQTGELNIPINLSLLPSNKGTRVSLLIGFNIRRH